MRITNGMLINHNLSNINSNKTNLDHLNTQLASEKVIQRASDDPIIAIRALRYRSTLSEIEQYLKKNIPDARSWMETTEEVLGNSVGLMTDITAYCNQAVNGYYDETNKNTIVESLKAYRDQIYASANADLAGRTLFTGYKTNDVLAYTEDNEKTFEITQKLTADDLDTVFKIADPLDFSNMSSSDILAMDTTSVSLPTQNEVYRLRLAYTGLDDTAGITIKVDGSDLNCTTKSSSDADAYDPAGDEIFFLADTGEIICGKNRYNTLASAEEINVTYTKSGFKGGDLNPIMYFDCVDKTDSDSSKWVTYTNRDQRIDYEINFNQTMTINTQGKDVYTVDMKRDLDDIIAAVNDAIEAKDNYDKIYKLYNDAESGSSEQDKYKEILDLCSREVDFANDNMKKAFTDGMEKYANHQNNISLQRAKVGTKLERLDLNESRLESQQTTVENLKSLNEDANVTEVAVELEEASSIYDASLAAAAKVVHSKLLDFL